MGRTYCSWILGLSAFCLSFPLYACSYDGQPSNPFTESYPGSLDIAFATSAAVDNKQISIVDELEGQKGLRRVSWWLKLMLDQHGNELQSVSYIYLVDSHLWSQVVGSSIRIHASPVMGDRSSVLMLSEAALYALVGGQVDFAQALELGIIQYSS
ncbi:hypothetical protein H2O73_04895 [Vibrio sp. 404]|uniref:Uncharacterized protein n=1 Tax=Vibrio marinisediminis TaxID=2758441 RepID=A0A7W2IT11_9VIBR|nr:hypothetical protein [Vibrio marinisediminis]MBA5761678.1 hypothetical protein [Vibrio marinisediminis]